MEDSEPVINLTYSLKRKETDDSDSTARQPHFKKKKRDPRGVSTAGRRDGNHQRTQHKTEKSQDKAKGSHSNKQRLTTFSSVFRCNPEIPQVQCAEVDKVKEAVFSKDSFQSLDLHPHLVSSLQDKMKLTTLTSVQKASIPRILEGRDVLVKSQTGSGKTLAYAIPLIQCLQGQTPRVKRSDGPYAIVIVPTRELALQSFEVIRKLVNPFVWIVPGSIMGGERKKSEKARLRKGINVLVSTPGRLLDHMDHTQSLGLSHLRWLIIDEADRLLDMGFEKEVSRIIEYLSEHATSDRQTVLLSATLSPGVDRLAGMSLHSPVTVDISQDDSKDLPDPLQSVRTKQPADATESTVFSTPDSLKHYFVVVPSKVRLVTLAAFILGKCKFSSTRGKMIVFMSTQDAVEFHHSIMQEVLCSTDDEDEADGSTSAADDDLLLLKLHGDMPQKERTKVFHDFCHLDRGVLLCTDVAARGLDLPAVNWIVQCTPAESATDYIHRVGRTARMGTHGQALLFLMPSEVEYLKTLAEHNISLTELKMDDLLKTTLMFAQQRAGAEGRKVRTLSVQESATQLQILFEEQTQNKKDMKALARKAYQSYIRAYTTYPAQLKHVFHVKHLHLGHVAKSFALQEAPKHIGGNITKQAKFRKSKANKRRMSERSKPVKPRRRPDTISEFSSGLSASKPHKKT